MYIVLAICLIFFAIGAYFLFDKDICSPTIITCLIYLFATILAQIGTFSWNTIDISLKAIFIICFGIISFGIGEFITRKLIKKKKNEKPEKDNYIVENEIIKIKMWKSILILLFVVLTIILMILEMRRICIESGYEVNGISKILSTYRKVSPLFSTKLLKSNNTINVFVSQMKKVCDIICITISYVLINNLLNEKWKKNVTNILKNNILNVVILIACYALSLLTTGRAQLMKYIVAAFFIYMILNLKKFSQKIVLKRTIIVGMLVVIIIIPLFYFMLPLIGRKTNSKFTDYITFYFGCSIPSFESYLDNPPEGDGHFGSETLYGVQSLLYKLKLSDYINPISREWTKISWFKSNVYTGFRRYMQDFGVLGVAICSIVFGMCFSKLYMNARNKKDFRYLLFFTFYSYMLIDQVRDELFFTRFIHINTILNAILIIVLSWGIFKFEFKDIPQYKDWIINNLKSFGKRERIKSENTK